MNVGEKRPNFIVMYCNQIAEGAYIMFRNLRKFSTRSAAVASALVLSICAASPAWANNKNVSAGIGPDIGTAIHAVIALKKNFFVEEGLNVELKKFAAGLVQVEALAAGNLDFAVPAQSPVISLRSAGIPIVILANTATWSGAFGLVVRADSKIANAKDLAGKKIAMLKGSTGELMFRAILDTYGIKQSEVESLTMQPPTMVSALLSKSIDGIVTWEPWIQQAVNAGGILRHTGNTSLFEDSKGKKVKVDWTRTVLVTQEQTIKSNPQTVDAFVRAFVKAQNFVSDPKNRDEVIKIFAEYQNQDPNEVALQFQKFDVNMRLDSDFVDGMQKPLDFLNSLGRIKKKVTVREFVHPMSLQKVRPDWVSIK